MGTEKLTPVEHLAYLRDEIYFIQMKICVAQKAKDERIQELDAMVMDLASVRDEAYEEIVRKDKRIQELEKEFASIRENQHLDIWDGLIAVPVFVLATFGAIYWLVQLFKWIG